METTRTICLSSSSTPQLQELGTHASGLQLQEINTEASTPLPKGIVADASAPQIEEAITEDGILCNILSSLPVRDAARASVLSPRWRHLWTHRTNFDFHVISVLGANLTYEDLDTQKGYKLAKGKTKKFIHSVNSILQQLQGARLYTFAVRYFLDKSHSRHLDEWVRFAVESRTKLLRLNLFQPDSNTPVEPYDFPFHIIGPSSSIERMSLIFCSLKLPFGFNGLSHLKQVALIDVRINEEDFNRFFTNCPTLKKLGVWRVPQLTSICIPQPLSQLHTLLVHDCHQLRKIEINAVNLLKLDYKGFPVDFRFRQSIKLNAHICFKAKGRVSNLDFYLVNLSSSLHHLQSLTLKTSGVSKVSVLPKYSSRFVHLKHLEWEWNDKIKMNLHHLTTLLDVAPYLEELKLCFSKCVLEQPPQTPSKFRKMLTKQSHTHLKTIQVGGFYFVMWQIEIAAYLLNKATKLEKLTIDKDSRSSELVSEEIHETGMKILNQEAPANVKLVMV